MNLKLSEDLKLPLDAATQTFAFIGRKGSGKTYGSGKLTELLIEAGIQIAILDTVGNWYGLRLDRNGKSPGIDIPIIGGLRGDIPLEPTGGALVADIVVETGRSLIIDMSQFSKADRQRFATAFGERLWKLKKAEKRPIPVHLVIEESQLIIPENVRGDSAAMVGIYEEIIRLGRNYGIGVTMITQRPQSVNKEVLNQTECLMVFQVNGAHERKALKEWIVHQGMDVKLLDELPGLQPGQCFVWSPQWLQILKKIKIASKHTFDSTATPKTGGISRGREIKTIDLAEIKAKMEATIERAKADDPKELRKKINDLERQLKNQPTSVNGKVKEIAVFKDGQIKRIESCLVALENMANRHGDAQALFWGNFNEVANALLGAIKTVAGTDKPPVRPSTQRPAQYAHKPRKEFVKHEGQLPIGEMKTLSALIQYPNGLERNQLTTLTGYKRSSRDAYLARLSQKGFVESNGSKMIATDDGKNALPDFEPLPSGTELRNYWLRKLPEGERAILSILIGVYPEEVDRDLLDEQTGYKRSSRDAYLARLTAKELVESNGRGTVRASENLFD